MLQAAGLQLAKLCKTPGVLLVLWLCCGWLCQVADNRQDRAAAARPWQYSPPLHACLQCPCAVNHLLCSGVFQPTNSLHEHDVCNRFGNKVESVC